MMGSNPIPSNVDHFAHPGKAPLILAYHSVSDRRDDNLSISEASFTNQMAYLHRNGYRSMTLGEYIQDPTPPSEKIVIITFDDGYEDNHSVAFPVLREFGYGATIFLTSDYTGTDHIHLWDRALIKSGGDPGPYRLLSWDQVLEMAAHGIEIGSHTCTHRRLTTLSEEQAWQEINSSRIKLAQRLKMEITCFCYPAGRLDHHIIRMVEQGGYRCGVVTPPRRGIPYSRYTLRRAGVYRSTNPFVFWLKTQPIFRQYHEIFMSPHHA